MALWNDHLLTVHHRFTLHLVTDDHAAVAHAGAAGLGAPELVVLEDLTVVCAAVHLLHLCFLLWGGEGRGWGGVRLGADGTALSLGCHSGPTVHQVLTLDLLTHHRPSFTHTDLTRLWAPYLIVGVDIAVFCTAVFVS